MINYVILFDFDLNKIGFITDYISVIWDKRYNDTSEFELYIPATSENFNLIKSSTYVMRPDDDMVGLIKKVELDTSAENGDFLTVSGYGAEVLLNQRIVWEPLNFTGTVENLIRKIINDAFIDEPSGNLEREMVLSFGTHLINLDEAQNFKEATTTQISYKNVGEKVKELCKEYGWGYRLIYKEYRNKYLYFQLYKGQDLSKAIIFTESYGNIAQTKYTEDSTDIENVALVGGEGEGAERKTTTVGTAEGTERFEIFVDAKDVSSTMTYAELKDLYPLIQDGGEGYIESTELDIYMLRYVDIPVITETQLEMLKYHYDGEEIVDGEQIYYRIRNVMVAELPSSSPTDDDEVSILPVYFLIFLYPQGAEALVGHDYKTSFEGQIIPDVNYKYKTDYNLGDIVKIKNKYGISVNARITEVLESFSDEGYKIEPKYEYITTESEE